MEGSEILIIIIFFLWIKRVNRKDDSNYYLPSQELVAIEEELAKFIISMPKLLRKCGFL